VQVGGAAGTLAALGPRGPEVNAVLAEALELNPAHAPWHVQRDNLVEFGNWLSLTAGILGKMGQDMLLLSQSDVGEIGFRSGGKSSTLPNKNNPVAPEFLVSLARYSQQQAGALAQSVLAGGERDGVSMTLESLTLAPLVCAAGAAMKLASEALADMEIVSETMARNIDADRGRMLAEAATFELSRFMERGEASALVARACRLATENETHMIDELSKLTQAEADWQALKELRNHLGAAQQIIDRALKS
ncbi:MAG TPA: lyase family protein, partial [Burkholderiaceae bacterium]|nr:lyase family protein [Burkholderiaceae bacterium]